MLHPYLTDLLVGEHHKELLRRAERDRTAAAVRRGGGPRHRWLARLLAQASGRGAGAVAGTQPPPIAPAADPPFDGWHWHGLELRAASGGAGRESDAEADASGPHAAAH